MIVMLSLLSVLVISCGGGGGSSDGSGSPRSGLGSGDFVKLSIDGGVENTFTEAFSATIVCDPRVDWAFSQVILYDNYLGGGQWGKIFDIMFGVSDAVGPYDIALPTDGLMVVFLDGTVPYVANFAEAASSGTVNVTRSDTRIEGTFTITAVDGSFNPITLSGSFGVDSGIALSCS
jgi:hypothetical protein